MPRCMQYILLCSRQQSCLALHGLDCANAIRIHRLDVDGDCVQGGLEIGFLYCMAGARWLGQRHGFLQEVARVVCKLTER